MLVANRKNVRVADSEVQKNSGCFQQGWSQSQITEVFLVSCVQPTGKSFNANQWNWWKSVHFEGVPFGGLNHHISTTAIGEPQTHKIWGFKNSFHQSYQPSSIVKLAEFNGQIQAQMARDFTRKLHAWVALGQTKTTTGRKRFLL